MKLKKNKREKAKQGKLMKANQKEKMKGYVEGETIKVSKTRQIDERKNMEAIKEKIKRTKGL